MKKKSVLEYAGRKPAGKRKCTITADIVKIGTESYLIADLWKEKAHIYRMAAGFNDYANYDYKTAKWDKRIRWNNEYYSKVRDAYISDADTKKITYTDNMSSRQCAWCRSKRGCRHKHRF